MPTPKPTPRRETTAGPPGSGLRRPTPALAASPGLEAPDGAALAVDTRLDTSHLDGPGEVWRGRPARHAAAQHRVAGTRLVVVIAAPHEEGLDGLAASVVS